MKAEDLALTNAYQNQDLTSIYIERYDSWSEMLDHVSQPVTRTSTYGSEDENTSQFWTAGVDWPQALQMMANGWPDGTSAYAMLLTRLQTKLSRLLQTHDLERGMTGCDFDLGAALSGQPECYVYPTEIHRDVKRGGGVRTLILNTGVRAAVTSEQILRRSVHTIGLMHALENAGYGVRIVTSNVTSYSGPKSQHRRNLGASRVLTVREPGQDIDLARMAFIGHPAWHRRIGFRTIEHMREDVAQAVTRDLYGASVDFPPAFIEHVWGPGCIYISPEPHLWDSDEIAWATMVQLMKAQGVELADVSMAT